MVLSSDRFTGINKPTLCCVLQNLLSILDFFERGREWSIVVVSYLKYLLLPEIFLSVSPDMKSALHSLLNKQICIAKTMVGTLCAVTILIFLISSCCNKSTCYQSEQRQKVDSIVKTAHSIKELDKLYKHFEAQGDYLGSIVALREIGKFYRNESKFDEALRIHSECLKLAEAEHDTIEWVQALNNIGTNYRRLGVFDAAQEYHYRAWRISEESTDTSSMAQKNRVMSLNGLGNIYMTIGNYDRADSAIRLALIGEKAIGSYTGQAINNANIGSIFEHKKLYDSAWIYFRRSMELNKKANNKLGISLCHTYFGLLYEKAHQYDEAYKEYEISYNMMRAWKDEWHALISLIALANLDYIMKNEERALQLLQKSEAIAKKIKSKEHLADIHNIYYKIYEQKGDYRNALKHHVRSAALQDSVVDMEKMNHIQNISLRIERNRQMEQVNRAKKELASERTIKNISYGVFALVVLFLLAVLSLMYYIQRIRSRNHQALKQASSLRENFFTNITHEFRTPLSVILGLSRNIVDDKKTDNDTREKLLIIQRQGNNLLTLINQLLDISKVKSAVGEPDWRSGNIATHISMIVESYRDYARTRKVNLQYTVKGDIITDFVPDYINKIMNNLLSNAFKFTPEYGKITVFLWKEDNRLMLDIADTGSGISEEDIAYIFEPFYQAPNENSTIGTGVGLALVKQIVDSIDGTITAESTLGKGTTFHLTIPILHGKKRYMPVEPEKTSNTPLLPQESQKTNDSETTDNDNLRLLIIEDNSDVAAYIGSQLVDKYATFYATNGAEGLEKAQEIVPDLIITDLMMPGMSGLEVCRKIRANEIINHIPIIIITAKITEADRVAGLEAGADAYLAKPFNSAELRTRVEKLVEQRNMLREKYSQIEEVTEQPDNTPIDRNIESDRRFLTKLTDRVYIMMNNEKEIDVKQLASQMCMSYTQFYRKLSALTGHTPTSYLQRIRIRRAKQLLDRNPEINFRDVAQQCGFTDYSNFVRAFKNVCGITPTQYQRGYEED